MSCGEDSTTTKPNTSELSVDNFNKEVPSVPTKFEILTADQTGLNTSNNIEESESFNHFLWASIYNGSGVGVADFNNDGLPDIYMGQNSGADKLFLNKGGLQFEDISETALPKDQSWTSGVCVVDINNDGWMDIYVSKFGMSVEEGAYKNQLLLNQKNNTFKEVARDYGVDDDGLTTMVAFFDVDKDGDKDLYVVNQPPDSRVRQVNAISDEEKPRYSDRLYIRNAGGRYIDRTEEYNLINYAPGLNVLVNDINDDGWLDLYVSNDYEQPDFIYINQDGKGFKDELQTRTGHISNFSMGSDVGDINNDGLNDLGILDMASSDHYRSKTNMGSMSTENFWANVNAGNHFQYMFNTIQLNQGDGYYSEVAQISKVGQTDWSWSLLFEDFNLDGRKDIYVTNGIKKDIRNNDFIEYLKNNIQQGKTSFQAMDLLDKIPSNPISNYYFENQSQIKYENATEASGAYDPDFSSGAAVADFDRDGDKDIIVSVSEAPSKLLENTTLNNGKTLRYNLDHGIWNEFLNASFFVVTNFGIQRQDMIPTRGYLSSMWDDLIFGLPQNAEVKEAFVKTIYGDVYELPLKYDEIVKLSKENLKPYSPKWSPKFWNIFKEESINYTHLENEYDDFKKEILLPHKLSEYGPAVTKVDLDGDGTDEIFVGGSLNQPLTQLKFQNGEYVSTNEEFWKQFAGNENSDLLFFDVDNDNDLDLYVANGGNEWSDGSNAWIVDQLFKNNGKGNFELDQTLAPIARNSSKAIDIDIDNDNDLDLVVFCGHMIGQYPKAQSSYVLKNENGKLELDKELSSEIDGIGIIKDAIKIDYDGDGNNDIVAVGDWTIPNIILAKNNKLQLDFPAELAEYSSWWNHINKGDFNGDGREDIIIGSFGENNKFHPSKKKPLEIFGNDFDNSGSNDVVLAKHYKDKVVPTRGRECSSQQIPVIKEKFPTYNEFALADLEDILGEDKINEGAHAKINGMDHIVIYNLPSGWQVENLPELTQIAPLKGTAIVDINGDGNMDVIGIGNHHGAEVETARYDAGQGWVLLGSKDNGFTYVAPRNAGFSFMGDGREVVIASTDKGKEMLAFFNNAPAKAYKANF